MDGIFGKQYHLQAISCAANTSSSLSTLTLPGVVGGKPLSGIPEDFKFIADYDRENEKLHFSYHDVLSTQNMDFDMDELKREYKQSCRDGRFVVESKTSPRRDYDRWSFERIDADTIKIDIFHHRIERIIYILFFSVRKKETVDDMTCYLQQS